MFLHQKLKYTKVTTLEDFKERLLKDKPQIIAYDTETTGLNFMKDKPFLVGVGYNKTLYVTEPTHELFDLIFNLPFDYTLWAHNAKYDYHMLINAGHRPPEKVKLADSLALARLTQYADDISSISLESLGQRYIDPEAKFAGKVIQTDINRINHERLKFMKNELKKKKLPASITEIIEAYRKRIQFIEHPYDEIFNFIDTIYKEPNYEDSYKENPNLMINYLYDDIVITLEFIRKALPVLNKTGKNVKILQQENELIRVVGDMERNGLRVDIDYLLESRKRVLDYKTQLYSELNILTGQEFTVGQHKVIKELFESKYGIVLDNTDLKALQDVTKHKNEEAAAVASIIIELRTIDKWLSTYIEGKLNKIIDGRIYTNINNSGTVTGRVASDFQQEPKEPLLDRQGNELFHPRRVVINDEGSKMYYFDYSQMELRVQAQYTIDISGGDSNLCRAFIPFNCKSIFTGETYKLGDEDWNTGEWVDEKGNFWEPVDLHSITTLKAFPELGSYDHPEFKHYRKYGKMCNFLKNYGGGIEAIKAQIIDDDEIATKLNQGYYEAFPKILDYQKWVESELSSHGFVENLYGRRYYLQSSNYYYKAYNYLIQGSCADIVKEKEIRIDKLLKPYKSKMLLPVHDEIQVSIYDGEEHLIKDIQWIMHDSKHIVKQIPMICDIEVTHSSWAEKIDYKVEDDNNE
jgi:DNA polymerase-1